MPLFMNDKKQPGDRFLESFLEVTKNLNLSRHEVAKFREVVGITQNLLDQWLHRGLVKPTQQASGPGERNLYDELSMCQALLLKELNACGFNLTRSSELAYQPKVAAFFAVALAKLRESIRKHRGNKTNFLLYGSAERVDYYIRKSLPWVTAAFSTRPDGTTETDYLITDEDFVDFYYKCQEYSVTVLFNLTLIAWRVNMKL